MARKTMFKLPGFAGVDLSGGSFHIQSGDYLMKCLSAEEAVSKSSDNEMLVFKFEGLEKAAKGKQFRLHCTLTPNALWKLGQTLRALGIDVPDEPTDFDLAEVEGVEVIGTVTDNEYEGKINSRLSEVRAATDVDDEAPATKKNSKATATTTTKSSTKNGKPKLAASEVEDMAEDELFEINEKYDLGLDLDAHKTTIRKRNAVIAGLQSGKHLEG